MTHSCCLVWCRHLNYELKSVCHRVMWSMLSKRNSHQFLHQPRLLLLSFLCFLRHINAWKLEMFDTTDFHTDLIPSNIQADPTWMDAQQLCHMHCVLQTPFAETRLLKTVWQKVSLPQEMYLSWELQQKFTFWLCNKVELTNRSENNCHPIWSWSLRSQGNLQIGDIRAAAQTLCPGSSYILDILAHATTTLPYFGQNITFCMSD